MGGRLTLSQPRHGFRAGLDSVLLGASVAAGTTMLLDLGAGVGTAGMVALSLGRAQRADLLERDPEIALLARDNAATNGFADRCRIVEADLTEPTARRAAGLLENGYDVVIANPPFFAEGHGTMAPKASRAEARHMQPSTLHLWVRCAAASAVAGGTAIFIFPAQGLTHLLSGLAGRFGSVVVLPLSPRPGAAATRILVRGIKGSRAPLTLLSSRALHGSEGNSFAPEFEAIFRGTATLDW